MYRGSGKKPHDFHLPVLRNVACYFYYGDRDEAERIQGFSHAIEYFRNHGFEFVEQRIPGMGHSMRVKDNDRIVAWLG